MFNGRMNEMQRRKEQVFVFQPPLSPEPPDTDLYVVANEIQIIQAVVVKLRPPLEPPNVDSHTQISSSFDLQGRNENALILKPPPEPTDATLFAVVLEIKYIDYVTNRENQIAQILVAPSPL